MRLCSSSKIFTQQFFKNLNTGDINVSPKLKGLSLTSISTEDQSWLERRFKEEVSRALEECGETAPAPDGFNFLFTRAAGSFLKRTFPVCFLNFILGEKLTKR